ncbi:hypothetical protein [Litoreibacter roseus]|uniref:N-acetyltransferase domain-containing protein n=1 Tax=Litoreibacter roseus TaxID=2601869 RepID=A0A6N6JIB3_9RHOB|nr:hypothetical protein [Litoreibacter roseus]GFE64942.1 hypothetical protein KIN_20160 [Litoreibacter roseus]
MIDTLERPALRVSADDILESHFTLAARPGAIEPIVVDGAAGWTSPNPHPVLSLMRWTTIDPGTASLALDAVLARFRDAGQGFDWMTGPKTAHLVPLLYERGFIAPPLDVAAMIRCVSPDIDISMPKDLRVWKVEDLQDDRISRVMARGFDVSGEVGAIFHEAYLTSSPLQTSDVYAVSADGDDAPVGVGYLSYIGDGPSVLLRVSSTLDEYRGRGIYKALVLRRLADAAKQGRTQAFVHAYSDGSQRVLSGLGFESAGSLQLHRWRP